jgi:RNA recognition motif-containing protein
MFSSFNFIIFAFLFSSSVTIATRDNVSLGYGFVVMDSQQAADIIISKFNDTILDDNKITVDFAKKFDFIFIFLFNSLIKLFFVINYYNYNNY